MQKLLLLVTLVIIFISGCSTQTKVKKSHKQNTISNTGRYALKNDSAPDSLQFDPTTLDQWNIQPEARSRYGNHSPYVVFGKTYYLADNNHDFEQSGTASWYGKKFHGHTTSNMEIFDMYKLTAAHRTLPLPSYVEVTNLDNNKKIIVRVNDRGPFKSKRIIDLSWAAAKALDYDTKGLANVHIKLIHASGQKAPTTTLSEKIPDNKKNKVEVLKYLQIGAFSQKNHALNIASQLSQLILLPVHVSNTVTTNPLYRVRIGPLSEDVNIIDIIEKVHLKGFLNIKMVVE